jgi:hypothetical protein
VNMVMPLKLLSIAKHVKRRVDSNMDNNRQLHVDIEFPSFDA